MYLVFFVMYSLAFKLNNHVSCFLSKRNRKRFLDEKKQEKEQSVNTTISEIYHQSRY